MAHFIPHRISREKLHGATVTLRRRGKEIEVPGKDILDAKVPDTNTAGTEDWVVVGYGAGVDFQHSRHGETRFSIVCDNEAASAIHAMFLFLERRPESSLSSLFHTDLYFIADERDCAIWCTERGDVFQVLDQTVKKGYFPAILPVAAWLENWESAMGIAKPTDANPPRSHEGPLGWNHLSMFRLDGEGRGDTLATSVAVYQRFLRRHLRYANLFLFRLTNFEDVRRSYSLPRAFPENGRNPHVLDGAQRMLFLTMLCLPPHLTAALASWELRELSDQVAIDATKFDSWGRSLEAATWKLGMIIVLLLVLVALTGYCAFR